MLDTCQLWNNLNNYNVHTNNREFENIIHVCIRYSTLNRGRRGELYSANPSKMSLYSSAEFTYTRWIIR